MNPAARLALLAASSAAAIWVGASLYRHVAPAPMASSQPLPSSAPEEPSAPQPGVQPDHNIPEQLPEFSLADLAGRKTSVSQWRGKSLMINFWATWCAPCRREIPLLQSLHQEKSAQGFEVLGIAVDYPDKVRAFKDQFGIGYPLLVGEQDALDLTASLGVATPAFPFTVFTDRRGRVVTLYLGELHRPVAETILQVVDDLNHDRLALDAARTRIGSEVRALRAQQ